MAIAGLYKLFDHWHQEGTVWVISDTHFSDLDLIAGVENRPSDEEIVRAINSKVGRCDTLIHLGDVGNIEVVKQLRAKRKILVMGNHDAGRTNYERQVWKKKFDQEQFAKKDAIEEMRKLYPNCRYSVEEGHDFHSPFIYWEVCADNMLFDEVYEGPLMIAEKLILSHEPVDVPWAFNIHGHVHDRRHKNDKTHFNVCCDVINYLPINFNQWMKQGHFAAVETIHRKTIDKATERKKKRGGKKIGEK